MGDFTRFAATSTTAVIKAIPRIACRASTTGRRFHSGSRPAKVAFDQRASGMGVAGLGDAAASDGLAARLLARDQAEIGHELGVLPALRDHARPQGSRG